MATTGGNKGANFSKLVSVSSSRRIQGTTSDFIFNAGQNLQNVQRVSIPTVSFFNNIYNITNDSTGVNNSYTYSYLGNPPHTFTLTPGFYSLSQILALMNADISNTYGPTNVWTYDPITNLVSFNVIGGSLFVLNSGTNPSLGLMTSLGGGPFVAINQSYGGVSTIQITGTTFPLLSSPTQVYLRSSTLAPSNSVEDQGRFTNTLLALAVNAPYLNLNLFECKVDSLCEILYSRPRDINNIDIKLTDRDGNVIDLHGGTLNVELRVWFNSY